MFCFTLTAGWRLASDAIVIEGTKRNVAAGSDNGFSVYTHTAGSISSKTYKFQAAASSEGSWTSLPAGEKASSESSQGTRNSEMVYNLEWFWSGERHSLAVVQQENSSSEICDSRRGSGFRGNWRPIINNGFEQTVSNVYMCPWEWDIMWWIITRKRVMWLLYILETLTIEFDGRLIM